jgi:hypothetical protein
VQRAPEPGRGPDDTYWEPIKSITPGSDRYLANARKGSASTPDLARPYASGVASRRKEASAAQRKEEVLAHLLGTGAVRSARAIDDAAKRAVLLRREMSGAKHAPREHARLARQARVQAVLAMATSAGCGSLLAKSLVSNVSNNPLVGPGAGGAASMQLPHRGSGDSAQDAGGGGGAKRAGPDRAAVAGSGAARAQCIAAPGAAEPATPSAEERASGIIGEPAGPSSGEPAACSGREAAAPGVSELRVSRLESLSMEDLLGIKSKFDRRSGGLDQRAFSDGFATGGPDTLCTRDGASRLFSAMDTGGVGAVGWDGFLSFMVQYSAQAVQLRDEHRRKNDSVLEGPPLGPCSAVALRHPVPLSSVAKMAGSKYLVSTSRDGTLAWWDAESLHPVRTLRAETASATGGRRGRHWPLAAALVQRDCLDRTALLIGSNDRSILLFDVHSHDAAKYELKGRAALGCVPLAMAHWEDPSGTAWLSVGDERGCVLNYDSARLTKLARRCHPSPPFPRPTLSPEPISSFHGLHADWVSAVRYVPQLHSGALVTASLDATLKILDVDRGVVRATLAGHSRSVHCFQALDGPQVR